jgi:alkylhydroperoxidase/carboxymuconolactone decarboxylase family protein YurZ
MPDITNLLTEDQIAKLHVGYTTALMTAAISSSLPALYPAAAPYLGGVMTSFYGDLPSDSIARERKELSLLDRERCLIAILASQNDHGALAIHMYFALMEGLSSAEIAHILLLSGTYTGISHFSRGLFVEMMLLRKLAVIADGNGDKTPATIVPSLLKFFEPVLAP